jgi:hypothetical protein
MKHFTRERYLAMQSRDDVACRAADAAWDEAVEHYEADLAALRPDLPEAARQLLDEFYLHDAEVLRLEQGGDRFVITLQLDVPPHEVLTIAYSLAGQPEWRKDLFPWGSDVGNPLWLFDEMDRAGTENDAHLIHSVLFSNGWELTVPFRDLSLSHAVSSLPASGTREGG